MGSAERVADACTTLREHVKPPLSATDLDQIRPLLPLLRQRSGALAVPLAEFLADLAVAEQDPWPLIEALLGARDPLFAKRALDLCVRLAGGGRLTLRPPILRVLAERLEKDSDSLTDPGALETLGQLLGMMRTSGSLSVRGRIRDLYLSAEHPLVRRMAARILDAPGQPVSADLAHLVLGDAAWEFLSPYLAYTRASHIELLALVSAPGVAPPALASLAQAAETLGPGMLRALIAEIGWLRLNLGLETRRYVGLSVEGTLPLFVYPAEAVLMEGLPGVRRVGEFDLFIAHGGQLARPDESSCDEVISRFRAYNLLHADLLAHFLDVAPLTTAKVERLLEGMDRLVEQFVMLFGAMADDAPVLQDVYRQLRSRILVLLTTERSRPQLSAELTRLVQMFEDPTAAGMVRTLHGLKRFLHQRGLILGFRLVGAGQATDHTVDLVVAGRRQQILKVSCIRYADFEGDGASSTPSGVPYPVALVAEGFARQLLHRHRDFPRVDIYCYGNEVHYYLTYRNHPAFLRIDYSPPLRGGMIDLEYYGVSKFDLAHHPAPTLEALREFFNRLEFDVSVDATHVHARYDKERALNLDDLCRRAALLFCLVPYLMDLDWVVGGLDLPEPSRRVVARAWADSFVHWGVLPLQMLLIPDRRGIVTDRFWERARNGYGPGRGRSRTATGSRHPSPNRSTRAWSTGSSRSAWPVFPI